LGLNKYTTTWLVIAILSLLASLFFANLFYELYWQVRAYFDENGRYFDATKSVVYASEAKFYALPCVFFFCTALELFKRLKEEFNKV
jgi:hypothetical protein